MDLPNWIQENLPALLATAVTAVVVTFVKPIRDRVFGWAWAAIKWLWAAILALPHHLRLYRFVLSRKPLWSFRKGFSQQTLAGPTVITVMNFKGGVGKTTITANLAAALSVKFNKKVLVVDLDYQGSLSDLLSMPSAGQDDKNLTAKWLHSRFPNRPIIELVQQETMVAGVSLITAEYSLTDTEDNELLRWLMGMTGDDVRSRLLRRLKRYPKEIGERYDFIIMDAPPRMSLAAANALKASDFVLVPAKLEFLAVSPIGRMFEYLSIFKKTIRARFRVLGVVCNMTSADQPQTNENDYIRTIRETVADHTDTPVLFDVMIPDRKEIGRPEGAPIGYLARGQRNDWIRNTFDLLATQVLRRIEELRASPNQR